MQKYWESLILCSSVHRVLSLNGKFKNFWYIYNRAGSRSKLIRHLLRHHSVVYKNTFRASLIKKFLSFNLANLAKSSLNCQKHEISKTSKALKRKKFFDQTGSKCVFIHYSTHLVFYQTNDEVRTPSQFQFKVYPINGRNPMEKKFLKSDQPFLSYQPSSTGQSAKVGRMAGAA